MLQSVLWHKPLQHPLAEDPTSYTAGWCRVSLCVRKQLAPRRTNSGLSEKARGPWMGQRPQKPQESRVWQARATA